MKKHSVCPYCGAPTAANVLRCSYCGNSSISEMVNPATKHGNGDGLVGKFKIIHMHPSDRAIASLEREIAFLAEQYEETSNPSIIKKLENARRKLKTILEQPQSEDYDA
ncbi:hypothetical protein ABNK63_00550 [Rhodanobacter sp. IGA1.0]|uniref:Zinc ribbon domain-containing protein n=1 Tax=Rhodanobacter sp. IGA1.0 TaxID=3158582 RepID=A0AAU7QL81_9GAMM